MRTICCVGLSALMLAIGTSNTFGATGKFLVTMTGPQEVPGPGDPDGTASGVIELNDVNGDISWNFTYANIAAPTLMHIHTGATGVSGGVLISLGVATSGGAGTLISSTNAPLAQVASVLANPAGFYVNIHNAPFGGGAVRGQLGSVIPAVSEWGLMAMAALLVVLGAVMVRRRYAQQVRKEIAI